MRAMTSLSLLLPTDSHWSLPNAKAWRIACERGLLWVSARGDSRDYILWPGQEVELYARRDILIGALEDAVCRLEAPLPQHQLALLRAGLRSSAR